jgi:copper chaperone NosL
MGAVLATFAKEEDAQRLAAEQGGRVLRFDDIDQSVLQPAAAMASGMTDHQAHAGH